MKIMQRSVNEDKYWIIIPKEVMFKALHWMPKDELDYDIQILDGKPMLCIVKKGEKPLDVIVETLVAKIAKLERELKELKDN